VYITIDECLEIMRILCRDDMLTKEKVEKQVAELVAPQVKISSPQEKSLARRVSSVIESEEALVKLKRLTLEQTTRLVSHHCTTVQIRTCAKERAIQKEFGIDRDSFKVLRPDLVGLYGLYTKIVGDHRQDRRPLNIVECDHIFQEFGIEGADASLHMSDRGIDFEDFLESLEQIRSDLESDFDDMIGAFEHHPRVHGVHGGSRMISINDVHEFLASVEVLQDTDVDDIAHIAMKLALEDVLATSMHEDDMLDFDQVKRVMQRMKEIEKRLHHTEEVQAALAHGFRETELDELRETFDILDQDGSGSIEPEEAWGAVKALGFAISKATFSQCHRQVDKDGSGGLEFVEFLQLLKMLRDRDGCFATNRQVSTLNDLLRAELVHLLTIFHELTHSEADVLEHHQLLVKVCACFGLEPHDYLHKRLRAKTFQDLCKVATSKFESQTSAV
jgi:hypothetical protein